MASRTACPLCGSHSLYPILQRKNVPVHQHLIFRSQQDAIQIERGDLFIAACDICGFVFNQAFEDRKVRYGDGYENSQHASPRYQEHAHDRIRHLIETQHIRNAQIVEIGCGNGEFLHAFVQSNDTNTGLGFDPSYSGNDSALDGRIRFIRSFFDATDSDVQADVIVCRHVIEHIADPLAFLTGLREALKNSPQARLFFETPCIEWILRHQVIWDFFYEHCSYFSRESLPNVFAQAGFEVQAVNHVFGGQYLWLEATCAQSNPIQPSNNNIVNLAHAFARTEAEQIAHWQSIIAQMTQQDRLVLWGAGAKGVTFANLIDPKRHYFACLVDLNPVKWDGYVAGTGHPIISPQALADYGITCAVLLNPEYEAEVMTLLQSQSLAIKLTNLGSHETDH